MNFSEELFNSASIEELKKGYRFDYIKGEYVCIFCGEKYTKGVIYPHGSLLYDAEKAMETHIEETHGSSFESLVNMDKKYNDLSDIQKELLKLFFRGVSDEDIVKRQGGGSTSTIRGHRFKLREKERQARVLLAIMSLLDSGTKSEQTMSSVLRVLSQTEIDDLIRAYFRLK